MAGGDEYRKFVRIHRLVGRHAHDVQVDGVQRELGQDSRQNGRNTQSGVQQSGTQTRQHARKNGRQNRRPRGPARQNKHGGHRASGSKGAVHRQIGDVQQTEGNVYAQSHDAPDDALSDAAGQALHKINRIQRSKICRDLHGSSPVSLFCSATGEWGVDTPFLHRRSPAGTRRPPRPGGKTGKYRTV
ncbi:hypothetical protein SDC9_89008 [bioreactor metagenome]|uniref:Uncharacterized protein n=1 Tax=bioreactor metagenome TaxID=1076179 RepID=A0A644ZUL1_9ZZZZ